MSNNIQKKYFFLFCFFAFFYFSLAIIGGYKNYSPVPYWDMWDGYLDFYVKASSGDWSVWWAQHNEHRIFLARLLFWIDISIFDGQSIFLIIINYLLILLTYLLIRQFLHEQIPLVENSLLRKTLSLVIFILIFSWLQRENLIWGFQSQFVLAQFLPLLAFFLIHKSHIEYSRSNCFFITACIVGVLAVGTMANGWCQNLTCLMFLHDFLIVLQYKGM